MSQEIKKLLPVILLVAAVAMGWLSWQGYNDILIVQQQIKETEDKIAELNLAATKASTFVTYMKEHPAVVEKLNMAISDDGNKPNMVSVLANIASPSGLLLKNITFEDVRDTPVVAVAADAEPTAEDTVSVENVKLVFNGTYASLKNFLSFTEKSLKFMDVAAIDFKPEAKDKEKPQTTKYYDFSVTLKTYYIVKKEKISNESKILLANNLVDMSFADEKQFTDLVPPQNYNIDTTDTGDWGNKNIF